MVILDETSFYKENMDAKGMKIINPDNSWVELIDYMGTDYRIVQAARVSYGIDDRSKGYKKDFELLKYLMEAGHLGPFEHVSATFRVYTPLFVSKQWMRHRTQCLSGDTHITFVRPDRYRKYGHNVVQEEPKPGLHTLRELYRRFYKNEFSRKRIKNKLLRVYDEKNKEFTVGHIKDIIYSGKKEVFLVELEDGKKIKATKDHKFLTLNGWKTLEDAVGLIKKGKTWAMTKDCWFLINGEPLYRNKLWLKDKRERGWSVQQIADAAGCSYHTIRTYLRKFGLQFDPLQNLLGVNGKPPWNKGLKGYKINRIVTEEQKEKIRKARSGSKSNFWKGGVSSERQKIARWATQIAHKVHEKYDYTCQMCGKRGGKLHAHHIKPVVEHPELAYDFNNLITLCEECHKKLHKQLGTYKRPKPPKKFGAKPVKVKKILFVGTEDTYDIVVEEPYHNFVGNGIITHNSFNEISRRYTKYGIEFWSPDEIRLKDEEALDLMKSVYEHAKDVYNFLLNEKKVPKEIARAVLPTALFTKFYATANLRNWLHFLDLRTDKHAQYEIRELAVGIQNILEMLFPHTMYLWKNSKTRGAW